MAKYSRADILIRNTSYNFISQACFIFLAFLTTPYIVHKLGNDAYGILAIIGVVIGYFTFMDLGLSQALIKYISGHYARKEYGAIEKTIGTVLFSYLILGFAGAIAIIFLTEPIVTKILKLPFEMVDVSRTVFYISALGFLVNMPVQVFVAIPQALQHFDIINKIQMIVGSLVVIFTVILLSFGYFLKEIVVLNLLISVGSIFIYVKVSAKLLPAVSFSPKFDIKTFKILFRFGGFSSLGRLAAGISINIDKFLVGLFLPIYNLTYYVIPYNITSRINLIASSVTSAVFPAMSDMDTLNQKPQFQELYIRASKYIATAVILLTVLLVTLGGKLFEFWIGSDFAAKATMPLQILSVGVLINSLSWVPGTAASAVNKPELTASVNVLQAVIGILLCIFLIPRFGIVGAALSWAIRDIILIPFFIYFINRKISMIRNSLFITQSILRPTIAGLTIFLLSLLVRPLAKDLFSLMFLMLIVSFFYFTIAYFFILDGNEKYKIKKVINMFLKRLKPGAPDMMQAHSGYEDYPVKIIKNLETKFSEPSFSFYTFTYNRLLYTRRMIESLAENVSSKYQHVIVDQGSSDGTKEYLESLKSRYPKVDWEIVYLKENIGIAEGQKAATQRCNGNILIKIDNDCRVLSRHIDKHLAAIYRLTGLDYVLSPFPLGLIGNLGGVPRVGFEIYYSEDMDRYYTLGLAERIGGLFMCLPRVILDKTGGWLGYSEKYKDPKKHMYDDVYISEKIKGAGFKMAYIENDCAVEHQESTLGQHERYGDGYFKAKF